MKIKIITNCCEELYKLESGEHQMCRCGNSFSIFRIEYK